MYIRIVLCILILRCYATLKLVKVTEIRQESYYLINKKYDYFIFPAYGQ